MKNLYFLFVFTFFQWGCATYQDKVAGPRLKISSGNFEEALSQLKPLAEEENSDQLVYLLDYATALQAAGKLEDSNSSFMKADKLSELQDYHSVSKITGSLLFSEEVKQYKGDTFEKIFINAYLAMNFLEMGKLDDALVESRRINEKYQKLRLEDKQEFDLNPFSQYLSALCWEADQKWDDAYIAYKDAYKLSPEIRTIQQDLIRTAKLSRRIDDYKKWKTEFTGIEEKPEWYDRNLGELVIIYQQGWGPQKQPDPFNRRFPILRSAYNNTTQFKLNIQGGSEHRSEMVYDVTSAAIKTLEDDRAALLARRLGGFVAKEVAADQIRQKDEALGFLAWVIMHVSDRADLRQWSFLPQTIQVVRVYLPPGKYKISGEGLTNGGYPTGEYLNERELIIKSQKKTFLNWRSFK